jgi:putative protein kinase ArgK-like GTPase of G3E family
VPIVRAIASQGWGIEALLEQLGSVAKQRRTEEERTEIWSSRLREMLQESLLSELNTPDLRKHAALVASRQEDPYQALEQLRSSLLRHEERR